MTPNLPLPDGWIQQYDPQYDHAFWVDTRAKPPRAIWVHPYEDEQYLSEHPEARAKKEKHSESTLDAPPSYDAAMRAQPSESGEASKRPDLGGVSEEGSHTERKRGVFGRLKDKAIGTKEEREEQKEIRAERVAREEEQARQARMRQLEEREAYMRAHGGYAPYHPGPSYPGNRGYGNTGTVPGSFVGDNSTALLLGGLAGGLLLGDIFGGGF